MVARLFVFILVLALLLFLVLGGLVVSVNQRVVNALAQVWILQQLQNGIVQLARRVLHEVLLHRLCHFGLFISKPLHVYPPVALRG